MDFKPTLSWWRGDISIPKCHSEFAWVFPVFQLLCIGQPKWCVFCIKRRLQALRAVTYNQICQCGDTSIPEHHTARFASKIKYVLNKLFLSKLWEVCFLVEILCALSLKRLTTPHWWSFKVSKVFRMFPRPSPWYVTPIGSCWCIADAWWCFVKCTPCKVHEYAQFLCELIWKEIRHGWLASPRSAMSPRSL